MAGPHRDSFASRLIKNFLLYSIFYLAVQSVTSLESHLVPPALIWLGLLLSALLATELIFVTLRKSELAVLSISPSLLFVLLVITFPVYSALQDGPIEWSIRNVAIVFGMSIYCISLLMSIALGLQPGVRRELLGH